MPSVLVEMVDVVMRQRRQRLHIPAACPKCGKPLAADALVLRQLNECRVEGGLEVLTGEGEVEHDDAYHTSQVLTACCEHPLASGGYRLHRKLTTPAPDVALAAWCVVEVDGLPQPWRARVAGETALLARLVGTEWQPAVEARWNGECLSHPQQRVPREVLRQLTQGLLGQAALAALQPEA